jgi:hypothetical protein
MKCNVMLEDKEITRIKAHMRQYLSKDPFIHWLFVCDLEQVFIFAIII